MRESLAARLASASYFLFVAGIGGLALLFLVAPVVVALVMSFTAGQTLRFPPQGFSLRWYAALFDSAVSGPLQVAAINSIEIAALAALGGLAVAVPAAWGMSRLAPRHAAAVEPLFTAPLVLPSLVYGLAALIAATAIGLRPSLGLVVAGHIVIFGPVLFRTTAASAAQIDPHLEEASATLGATSLTTFRRVVLPLLTPGILAGVFLLFLLSMDNVTISLFLADPATTILPLRMFAMIHESLDVRVGAVSGLLILFAALGVVLGRRAIWLLRP